MNNSYNDVSTNPLKNEEDLHPNYRNSPSKISVKRIISFLNDKMPHLEIQRGIHKAFACLNKCEALNTFMKIMQYNFIDILYDLDTSFFALIVINHSYGIFFDFTDTTYFFLHNYQTMHKKETCCVVRFDYKKGEASYELKLFNVEKIVFNENLCEGFFNVLSKLAEQNKLFPFYISNSAVTKDTTYFKLIHEKIISLIITTTNNKTQDYQFLKEYAENETTKQCNTNKDLRKIEGFQIRYDMLKEKSRRVDIDGFCFFVDLKNFPKSIKTEFQLETTFFQSNNRILSKTAIFYDSTGFKKVSEAEYFCLGYIPRPSRNKKIFVYIAFPRQLSDFTKTCIKSDLMKVIANFYSLISNEDDKSTQETFFNSYENKIIGKCERMSCILKNSFMTKCLSKICSEAVIVKHNAFIYLEAFNTKQDFHGDSTERALYTIQSIVNFETFATNYLDLCVSYSTSDKIYAALSTETLSSYVINHKYHLLLDDSTANLNGKFFKLAKNHISKPIKPQTCHEKNTSHTEDNSSYNQGSEYDLNEATTGLKLEKNSIVKLNFYSDTVRVFLNKFLLKNSFPVTSSKLLLNLAKSKKSQNEFSEWFKNSVEQILMTINQFTNFKSSIRLEAHVPFTSASSYAFRIDKEFLACGVVIYKFEDMKEAIVQALELLKNCLYEKEKSLSNIICKICVEIAIQEYFLRGGNKSCLLDNSFLLLMRRSRTKHIRYLTPEFINEIKNYGRNVQRKEKAFIYIIKHVLKKDPKNCKLFTDVVECVYSKKLEDSLDILLNLYTQEIEERYQGFDIKCVLFGRNLSSLQYSITPRIDLQEYWREYLKNSKKTDKIMYFYTAFKLLKVEKNLTKTELIIKFISYIVTSKMKYLVKSNPSVPKRKNTKNLPLIRIEEIVVEKIIRLKSEHPVDLDTYDIEFHREKFISFFATEEKKKTVPYSIEELANIKSGLTLYKNRCKNKIENLNSLLNDIRFCLLGRRNYRSLCTAECKIRSTGSDAYLFLNTNIWHKTYLDRNLTEAAIIYYKLAKIQFVVDQFKSFFILFKYYQQKEETPVRIVGKEICDCFEKYLDAIIIYNCTSLEVKKKTTYKTIPHQQNFATSLKKFHCDDQNFIMSKFRYVENRLDMLESKIQMIDFNMSKKNLIFENRTEKKEREKKVRSSDVDILPSTRSKSIKPALEADEKQLQSTGILNLENRSRTHDSFVNNNRYSMKIIIQKRKCTYSERADFQDRSVLNEAICKKILLSEYYTANDETDHEIMVCNEMTLIKFFDEKFRLNNENCKFFCRMGMKRFQYFKSTLTNFILLDRSRILPNLFTFSKSRFKKKYCDKKNLHKNKPSDDEYQIFLDHLVMINYLECVLYGEKYTLACDK